MMSDPASNAPERVPRKELLIAIAGGATAGITIFVIIVSVGSVGDFKALRLIEATLPTTRFLASSAVAAGTTILALVLTLLSINLTTQVDLSRLHYRRVGYVTRLSISTIVLSTLVLIAVTVPIEEVEGLASYYDIMYYVLASTTSLVGGALVATALFIAETIYGLIDVADPRAESDLRPVEAPAD